MFTSSTYTEAGKRHTLSFLDGADWVSKPEESLRARGKSENQNTTFSLLEGMLIFSQEEPLFLIIHIHQAHNKS